MPQLVNFTGTDSKAGPAAGGASNSARACERLWTQASEPVKGCGLSDHGALVSAVLGDSKSRSFLQVIFFSQVGLHGAVEGRGMERILQS